MAILPITMFSKLAILILFILPNSFNCEYQTGPDPWDYKSDLSNKPTHDNLPPDLRILPKKKPDSQNNYGLSEWFFKRLLAIMLKGGQVKTGSDESVEISLALKFDRERWKTLEDYIASPSGLSDDMFRRSVGYIEEAIYKPTISEKIATAWSDYIQIYLVEYKMEITWTFGILAAISLVIWLWKHISHKHIIIGGFIILYFYEAFISYKEAEKQDMERFLKAVNICKWKVWSSSCEIPPPDLLLFLKHMNPLKIAVRMFTGLLCEPMITLSATIKTMIHGVTDGLWYPLDKIMFGILVMFCNLLLVILLIMIVFNFILNIPFKLSFLAGLFSIGVNQRKRTFVTEPTQQAGIQNGGDVISGQTLSKILDVCSNAINTAQSHHSYRTQSRYPHEPKLKRSSSTGRLPNVSLLCVMDCDLPPKKYPRGPSHDGSGDARKRQ